MRKRPFDLRVGPAMLRPRLVFAVVLWIALPLAAQSTANRITAPVDENHLVRLGGNVHPLALGRFDRGPAPVSLPTGRVALVLAHSTAQQQALTQFLADVQNPASAEFHRWLTPKQYGERFGPSEADVQTVEDWLGSHGFTVDKVAQARNFIDFSGTIEQIEDAFHTPIHMFSVGGELHYANVADPEIPAALVPVVAGITPLNDFHPRPNIRSGVTAHYDATTRSIEPDLTLFDASNSATLFVDPADAATIYDTPNAALNPNYAGITWDGTGVSIGIIGVSDLNLGDITNYREAFLAATAVTANLPTVVVDGDDPGLVGGGAADEALLDNEIAGGLAPGAKVFYYTSADSDLGSGLMNAYFRALDDNTVSILNISFSGCEAQQGAGGNQALLEAAEQAAAQGISVVVSAGDGGSDGCDDFNTATVAEDGFGVNGIASTPYTIAVGGTDFDVLSSAFSTYVTSGSDGSAPYYRTALGYIPEAPWNESTTNNGTLAANLPYEAGGNQTNIIAGGGGASSCVRQSSTGTCLGGYAKPAFQTSLTPADKVRDLPDVSLFASNGFYRAYWAFCSDSASDGNTSESYTECATTGGQLTSGASFGGAGGTSASAPAFAGMLALVAQSLGGARLGQADTVLYQLAQEQPADFHDIRSGNNSVPCASGSPNCGANGFLTGYNAGLGYDLASGLGSVDVAALVKNWSSVSLASTATSLSINGSRALYVGTHGANLTLNSSVSGNGGGTATGVVAIVDSADQTPGGTAAGPQNDGQFTIALKNGSGSGTWNGLPGGSYTVMARYGGDTSHAASVSSPISVTISPEQSTTALTVYTANPLTGAVIPSLGSIPYGSVVTFNAQITGTAEGAKTEGRATGAVTYEDRGNTLGTASVNSENGASWPTLNSSFAALPVGTHSVAAQYSGDASFEPSDSAAAALTVVKAATTTTIESRPAPVYGNSGQTSVPFAITSPYNLGEAPTGGVVITVDGQTVNSSGSSSWAKQGFGSSAEWALAGSASIPNNLLQGGSDTVILSYPGDANYASSSSSFTLTQQGGPDIALEESGAINVAPGATTGNTATIFIAPSNGFTGVVNLTCSITASPAGANEPPTCTIPASVSLSGTGAVTAMLTLNTTASSTTTAHETAPMFLAGGGATIALVLFFGVPARRRTWRTLFGLIALASAVSLTGCGGKAGTISPPSEQTGSANPGTSAGAYTVTVTGTDAATGTITASTVVAVTVT